MGSVNLDNTGSGSAITLSSDGTSLLLDGTAVGGGSPDLYAENYTSGTKPATTGTNAVAIGKGSSAAGTEAIAMVDGTADSQDSFAVGGIVQSAIGGYAIGKSSQVYSQYGLAIGQSSLVSASSYGTAVGYQSVAGANSAVAFAKSRAAGADSLAGAIDNNTSTYGATGANSIAMGETAKATASGAIAIGKITQATATEGVALGRSASATGTNSVCLGWSQATHQHAIAGGMSQTASGYASSAIGGRSNYAEGSYSATLGGYGARARTSGEMAIGTGTTSYLGGKNQTRMTQYLWKSTDATAKQIHSDGSGNSSSSNTVLVEQNAAQVFRGQIIANVTAAGDTRAWDFKGCIKRGSAASTTALVGTPVIDDIAGDSGADNWVVALTADTTLGGLAVTVTGQASTTIMWNCFINFTDTEN